MNNIDISEIPFYMVYSKEFGYHLYKSFNGAITAIEDTIAPEDQGIIYKMTTGPTYQDAVTEELYLFEKKNGSTLFTTADENAEVFTYKYLLTREYYD